MTDEFRIEKDSMGEVKVPKDALYAAQTQRAVDNFPVSGILSGILNLAWLGDLQRPPRNF